MNGDDPFSTDWVSSLTPEERRKLIMLTAEQFALALSSPTASMNLIGSGNRVAVRRDIQPIMAMNPSGKLVPLINSSNVLPVTEASGAQVASNTNITYAQLFNALFTTWRADGTAAGAAVTTPWFPITPVSKAAAGDGSFTVLEIVAAPAAGYKLDVVLFWVVSTTSGVSYHVNIVEATAGANGPTVPAFDITIPCVAGQTYGGYHGFRMMNTTAATNIGMKAQAAGSFPNSATITFFGFYRSVTA